MRCCCGGGGHPFPLVYRAGPVGCGVCCRVLLVGMHALCAAWHTCARGGARGCMRRISAAVAAAAVTPVLKNNGINKSTWNARTWTQSKGQKPSPGSFTSTISNLFF